MLAVIPLLSLVLVGPPQADQPVDYVLVVTGSELVEGVYADVHTQFITRTLSPLGAHCRMSISVGDRREDLLKALRFAREQASLIIVTGGLGPSDADLTRPVLAEFTGIPLTENRDVLAGLAARFSMEPDALPENIRRQARVPSQGTYLKNLTGTAVGLLFDRPDAVVAALPGPPDELQPMVTDQLIPYLVRRFGIRSIGTSITLRFVGVGESTISQAVHEHLELPDELILSYKFEVGRVDLTLGFPGRGRKESERLAAMEKSLREHLGEFIYADDASTLEEYVIGLLGRRNVTMAIAEVGSHGAVAEALSAADGSSGRLAAGLVAPSARAMAALLKLKPAELESPGDDGGASARTLAERVLRELGADWGVGIASQFQDADGSVQVWMAVASEEGGHALRKIRLRQGRNGTGWLVTAALDVLRRELEGGLGR